MAQTGLLRFSPVGGRPLQLSVPQDPQGDSPGPHFSSKPSNQYLNKTLNETEPTDFWNQS